MNGLMVNYKTVHFFSRFFMKNNDSQKLNNFKIYIVSNKYWDVKIWLQSKFVSTT